MPQPSDLTELKSAHAATASVIDKVNSVAPFLTQAREEFIRGQVWERPGLAKRDRALITVALDMAIRRLDGRGALQLRLGSSRCTRSGLGTRWSVERRHEASARRYHQLSTSLHTPVWRTTNDGKT